MTGDNTSRQIGCNWGSGPILAFRGTNYTDYPGAFELYPTNGETFSVLRGTPAGQLTWNGNTVITSGNVSSYIGTSIENVDMSVSKSSAGDTENGRGSVVLSGASLASSYSSQATFRTALGNTRSYIGSTHGTWGGWQNVISCRHRNGAVDGSSYGMYIRTSLTESSDNLYWDRGYSNGNWQGERTIIDSGNISSQSVNYANSARYVTGDSNASSPQGALLRSGTGRPNASPSGDTWIFYDDCGSYSSPWGIRANQEADTIGFVGAGTEYASINLSNGYYSGSVSWSNVSGRPFAGAGSDYATWPFNPLGATDQYWITGFTVGNSGLSNDTGCLRYYLSRNTPSGGGLSLCMDIDGFICTPGSMYAGTAFYTGSDRRFKKNIQRVLDDNVIPIKKFVVKNTNKYSYGFIAQELEAMGYPELVETGDQKKKSVNYNSALSLAIAQLQNKIKKLETEIEKLKKVNQ